MVSSKLPCFIVGTVVKGFGRGSKDLGIPTANYSSDVVEKHSSSVDTGIYYGWAKLEGGPLHKMVMSVGWNPFYKNSVKTMEVHIIHNFDEDFYGAQLKVCVLGFIRPELDFSSVDDLITQIKKDIALAKEELSKPENLTFCDNEFFSS